MSSQKDNDVRQLEDFTQKLNMRVLIGKKKLKENIK